MPEHTIVRSARGAIQDVKGCGADGCPTEDHDVDDETITYSCPVSGDDIAEVDVGPTDTKPANQPATTDELQSEAKRRR